MTEQWHRVDPYWEVSNLANVRRRDVPSSLPVARPKHRARRVLFRMRKRRLRHRELMEIIRAKQMDTGFRARFKRQRAGKPKQGRPARQLPLRFPRFDLEQIYCLMRR